MKIALISCFETYQNRLDDMEKYYLSKGHEVIIIKSDFLHFKKQKVNSDDYQSNVILLEVPKYKKNISIGRMVSHFSFSKRCLKFLKTNKFDLIHVLVPPNMLCRQLSKLNYETKIIYDVIDFWPETMPVRKLSESLIFKKWKGLRNQYINKSDFIITECELFEETLQKIVKNEKIKTVYFTRKKIVNEINYLYDDTINLVYLGSINNIIDINLIVSILKEISNKRKVIFHIIGEGENKITLLKELGTEGILFKDHGVIYDEIQKKEIFNKCSFAFNIMKQEVFVGLTMKSLDYFQFGIPIINNIGWDTEKLVNKYDVGINIKQETSDEVIAEMIINQSGTKENQLLRSKVNKMFEKEFQFNKLEKKMDTVMGEIVK